MAEGVFVIPERVKLEADRLDKSCRKLEQLLGEMGDRMAHTGSYWTGSGGDKCRREYQMVQAEAVKGVVNLRGHPTALLQIAGVYEETETAVTELGHQLPTNLL